MNCHRLWDDSLSLTMTTLYCLEGVVVPVRERALSLDKGNARGLDVSAQISSRPIKTVRRPTKLAGAVRRSYQLP